MSVERRGPAVCNGTNNMGGKGEMIKAPISLQDLRRSLYIKAKAEPTWRFWGLYVHVCKKETLQEAYRMAARNNGAPGIDGVTFDDIKESGVESFLGLRGIVWVKNADFEPETPLPIRPGKGPTATETLARMA